MITKNGLWIRDEINKKISIINAESINNNQLINEGLAKEYWGGKR